MWLLLPSECIQSPSHCIRCLWLRRLRAPALMANLLPLATSPAATGPLSLSHLAFVVPLRLCSPVAAWLSASPNWGLIPCHLVSEVASLHAYLPQ